MAYYDACENCGKRPSTECHHMFSKGTKKGWRWKKYGERLNHVNNLQYLCSICHHFKPLKKLSELEFLEVTKDYINKTIDNK